MKTNAYKFLILAPLQFLHLKQKDKYTLNLFQRHLRAFHHYTA
jgi:hypothetical protein